MPETDADLFGMTWEDAVDAYQSADLLVLPCGSIEQHSVHLPVSVDTLRADHLSAALVERAADRDLEVVRLPPLPYGYSEHHANFPGTVTFSAETYTRAITEIGESLARHDAPRLLLLNCHGGNREPLKLAADRIQRDHGLPVHFVHWTDFARDRLLEHFGTGWGHAGDHETSVVEHYRPDLVKDEKKMSQGAVDMPETRAYTYFDEVTELGGLGDPTNSDPAFLAELVEETTDRILDAVAEDLDAGW